MFGWRDEWRERKHALTRAFSGVGAIAMALLLAYGLWQSVPDRRAVSVLTRGGDSLERGDYALAKQSYHTALRLVPNSAVAHQGLACALYLTGMRSAATLVLTKGLEAGVFANRLGPCGSGLSLDDAFFAAKLGLDEALAVPKVAGARVFEEALLEAPTGTTAEEPDRMLLSACLAQRAGFSGAAWAYAGSALQSDAVDDSDRARFFACFDLRQRRRAGCASNPSIRACVMTPSARRAYFRDHHLANGSERWKLYR